MSTVSSMRVWLETHWVRYLCAGSSRALMVCCGFVRSQSDAETQALALLLLCREEDDVKRVATVPWRAADVLVHLEQLVSPDEIIPQGALGVRANVWVTEYVDRLGWTTDPHTVTVSFHLSGT